MFDALIMALSTQYIVCVVFDGSFLFLRLWFTLVKIKNKIKRTTRSANDQKHPALVYQCKSHVLRDALFLTSLSSVGDQWLTCSDDS